MSAAGLIEAKEVVLLSERRKTQLDQMLKETRVFARRADLYPEDRIALAEIERELLDVRQRWTAEGRIDGEEAARG